MASERIWVPDLKLSLILFIITYTSRDTSKRATWLYTVNMKISYWLLIAKRMKTKIVNIRSKDIYSIGQARERR